MNPVHTNYSEKFIYSQSELSLPGDFHQNAAACHYNPNLFPFFANGEVPRMVNENMMPEVTLFFFLFSLIIR